MPTPEDLPAWRSLEALRARGLPEARAVSDDFAARAIALPGLLADFSKQCIDDEVFAALIRLAHEAADIPEQRERLFRGDTLNVTERRPALHTALRAASDTRPAIAANVVDETLRRLARFATSVRDGSHRGHSGKSITDVVHIGIGGSHLRPELVVEALAVADGPACHFVANVDGAALATTLANLRPETTLFIVVSKSFTTLETQVNANSARSWFVERTGSIEALGRHFVGVTANVPAALEFGIEADNVYPLWDWVGGRFSLWSAVGLPIQLTAGPDAFAELLAGARAMDAHFRTAPPERNMPLLMALVGIWNYNFRGAASQAVLPYDVRLRLLPDYLQQLEMESNGKSVRLDGTAVGVDTMPIVWGNEGTNGQHAFHQLLHQGTRRFAVDFVLVANPAHDRSAPSALAARERSRAKPGDAPRPRGCRPAPQGWPATSRRRR